MDLISFYGLCRGLDYIYLICTVHAEILRHRSLRTMTLPKNLKIISICLPRTDTRYSSPQHGSFIGSAGPVSILAVPTGSS